MVPTALMAPDADWQTTANVEPDERNTPNKLARQIITDLTTSKGQYTVIIIHSATCWQQDMPFYTNSNIPCSICTFMFDKSPSLKTSTCKYSVIVIAPPSGSSKFGINDFLFNVGYSYIPLICTTLNAYCLPFAVPTRVAVSPGARALSTLLAALFNTVLVCPV